MAQIGARQGKAVKHLPGLERNTTIGLFLAGIEFFDLFTVALAGFLANWLRFDSFQLASSRTILIMVAILVAYISFRRFDLHDLPTLKSSLSQIKRVVIAMAITFAAIVVIGYATKTGNSVSRLWLGYWFALSGGALIATRPIITLINRKLEAAGYFARRFVVFATVAELENLHRFLDRWMRTMPDHDRIAGIFLDHPEDLTDKSVFLRYPFVGSIEDFLTWDSNDVVDGAVAVMRADNHHTLEQVLRKLSNVSVDLDLVAGHVDEAWASRPVSKLAGLPVIRIMTQPLSIRDLTLKRVEDILVATVALIVASPVMLLAAIAIKLDSPGPVIFRQPRHGFNNQKFDIFKFRSMRNDPPAGDSVQQAQRNDPRITRIGSILRRTSIDELPQLFNVLKGDMSVVGPRPHAIQHNDHFSRRIDSYLARHRIKPGITGWAQVNGYRGETETDDKMSRRVEHDLYYTDHWSLTFDIRIMVMTIRCLIHPNAY